MADMHFIWEVFDMQDFNAWINPAVVADRIKVVRELTKKLQKLESTYSIRLAVKQLKEIGYFCEEHENWLCSCTALNELLPRCFWRQLGDNDLVMRFLWWLDNVRDGCYRLEFFVTKHARMRPVTLEPEMIRERTRCGLESFSMLTYFLHHANQGRLTISGQKFLDVLLRDHVHFFGDLLRGNPQSVHSLFRYTAWFASDTAINRKIIAEILSRAIMATISIGVSSNLVDKYSLCLKVSFDQLSIGMLKMLEMVKLFVRLFPNSKWLSARAAARRIVSGHIWAFNVEDVLPPPEILLPYFDAILPGLQLGHQTPSCLRHTCRVQIRKLLYGNWQLPVGIYKLGLPLELCFYLDLFYD